VWRDVLPPLAAVPCTSPLAQLAHSNHPPVGEGGSQTPTVAGGGGPAASVLPRSGESAAVMGRTRMSGPCMKLLPDSYAVGSDGQSTYLRIRNAHNTTVNIRKWTTCRTTRSGTTTYLHVVAESQDDVQRVHCRHASVVRVPCRGVEVGS